MTLGRFYFNEGMVCMANVGQSVGEMEAAGSPVDRIPEAVRGRLNGEAGNVVAWSLFDVREDGKLGSRYLVLTDESLLVLEEDGKRAIPVAGMTSAKVVEGLGVDRLIVAGDGQVLGEFPYSRHCRREMTRLHRKLERKLPGEDGKPKEKMPDWLDAVERQTEAREYCQQVRATHSILCGGCLPGVPAQAVHPAAADQRISGHTRPASSCAAFMMLLGVALNALPPLVTQATIDNAINAQSETGERLLPALSLVRGDAGADRRSRSFRRDAHAHPVERGHDGGARSAPCRLRPPARSEPALFRQAAHRLADHARDQRHRPAVGLHRLRLGRT